MKAELDKDGTIWIKAETIAEALFMEKVVSGNSKYEANGIVYDWNLPDTEAKD